MIREKFKNITVNLNSLIGKGNASSARAFDKYLLPIVGIDKNKGLVYYNLKFKKCFGNDIDSLVVDLTSSAEIKWQDNIYSKSLLCLDKDVSFYLITKQEKHHTQTSFDSMPYVVLNSQGKIVDSNKTLRKLLNVTKATMRDDFYSYLNDSSVNILDQGLKDNSSSLEIKFNTDQNIAALIYNFYQDADNNFHCFLIDITEYKNLETHLIHSQKMQAIGQLAGGIAHDFNNLLTAMIGFCDLLLIKHPAGDPSFAEIMQIKQTSNRAANLVRQLLAISRKQVLKPKILNITDVIEELVNLIRRLTGEKVTLDIKHGKNLSLVKVDQGQLEQVIINLTVNARDAILAKGDKGTVSVVTKNAIIKERGGVEEGLIPPNSNEQILPGEYVLIEVRDTGIGMAKDIIAKIFEPFFSTKELGSGTGLGLSTVYGIVKQIGGYVYISSKSGSGTKFYVYLKASNKNETGDTEMLQDIENKLIQKDLTGDATILLVEDEVPVRMFSSSALSNKGYDMVEAESGEEGLEIVKKRGGEIDIIITDVIMPGMNGPTFIAEVHKIYPKTKVIFMSGYAEEAFSKAYGMEENFKFNFLCKPFTLKQLASKVKEVLEEGI
jgi:signal transduction histidine kinase